MDTTLGDNVKEDILDKARTFQSTQKKIIIRTKPSTRFPKGAKYEGFIVDVLDNRITFNDTYKTPMKTIIIYLSEIASSSDLWEFEQ